MFYKESSWIVLYTFQFSYSMCICAKLLQLCLVLCNPMDCILPGSSPLSMGSSRQEYWSGLTYPPPWDLSDSGIKPMSLTSPVLADRFFTIGTTWKYPSSVHFSSVTQSCPTLCNPINHSTPGLPVHHHPPEFTQTHVHWVCDAIQSSHPLSSPSPPAPNPSQHQSIFQWVNSSHEVAKVLEVQL